MREVKFIIPYRDHEINYYVCSSQSPEIFFCNVVYIYCKKNFKSKFIFIYYGMETIEIDETFISFLFSFMNRNLNL